MWVALNGCCRQFFEEVFRVRGPAFIKEYSCVHFGMPTRSGQPDVHEITT